MRSYKVKFFKAIFKAILLSKLRQIWSQLGAWLNVHKHFKDSIVMDEVLQRDAKASARSKATHILAQRKSKEIFMHLERVKGILKCNNPQATEMPSAPDAQ